MARRPPVAVKKTAVAARTPPPMSMPTYKSGGKVAKMPPADNDADDAFVRKSVVTKRGK